MLAYNVVRIGETNFYTAVGPEMSRGAEGRHFIQGEPPLVKHLLSAEASPTDPLNPTCGHLPELLIRSLHVTRTGDMLFNVQENVQTLKNSPYLWAFMSVCPYV
jgi:hypothetical protein